MQIDNIIETLQATGFESEILPDFAILQPKSHKTLSKQSRIGRTTCANCANSIEKILQSLPPVKGHPVDLTTSLREIKYVPSAINKYSIVQTIEDGCFEIAFLQSSKQTKISLCLTGLHTEKDVDILHDVLKKNYLRQRDVNTALSETEIVFDPETIGLRSIVHTIQMGINGILQMHVQDLYTQKSSNTAQEASKISKLPHSSLFLSLLESFEKSFPTLRFPPLPERADFDLKDVLEAPYFFN